MRQDVKQALPFILFAYLVPLLGTIAGLIARAQIK